MSEIEKQTAIEIRAEALRIAAGIGGLSPTQIVDAAIKFSEFALGIGDGRR